MTGRPGRPRRIKVHPNIHGVSKCPEDKQSFMEFAYQTPAIMRRLITMLRAYYADIIRFDFTTASLLITASDHTGRVPIIVHFDCNNVLRYHCREPFRIATGRLYLDKLASTITCDYNTVRLTSNAQNYQSSLQILFSSDEMNDQYEIDLCPRSNTETVTCVESDYLITFKVKSRFLKSFTNHGIATKSFGIEYNNCCVSLASNIDMKVFYKKTFIKTVVLTSVEYFLFVYHMSWYNRF
jgi:hypothetical protein